MPKRLDVDWSAAKAAYVQGVKIAEIARQLGIKDVALRARCHRHGWPKARADAANLVQHAAIATMEDRGKQWVTRVVSVAEKHLAHIERIEPGKMKLTDLEMLFRLLDVTDRTGRRSLGLSNNGDSEGGKPTTVVQVNLGSLASDLRRVSQSCAGGAGSDVIDVSSEPEQPKP